VTPKEFQCVLRRKNSGEIKTFGDANRDRKKSVHVTFQTLFLRQKCGLKNNIIKYIQDLEGRFRLYSFQVS
jgi:hypothetical protein